MFLEIVLDLLTSLVPWSSVREDRSVVGESDLDRKARRLKIWLVALVIAGVVAAVIVFYFLSGK